MSSRSISLTDSLYGYLLEVSLREPDLLLRLREETAAMPMARMQVSPEQGQFLQLLVRPSARVAASRSVRSPAIRASRSHWRCRATGG